MKLRNKNKKGFTLIELLVAVLVIGLLAAIAIPFYFKAMEKTRATEAISMLGSIARAEDRIKFASEAQEYTDQLGVLDINPMVYSQQTASTFDSEYFNFKLTDTYAQAERKPTSSEDYTIYIDYATAKLTCSNKNGSAMCKRLGLEEVNPPSKFDTRNIQDWVLEDYIDYVIEELTQIWHAGCGNTLNCLQDVADQLCTYDGEGTCMNTMGNTSSSLPSKYVVGADGNTYFWGMHDGQVVLNANTYGNNPYFVQIDFRNNGGIYMRIGSGSANAEATAKLEELKERYGDRHFVTNTGWNYFYIK